MRKSLLPAFVAAAMLTAAALWALPAAAAGNIEPANEQPKASQEGRSHEQHNGHKMEQNFEAYRLEKLKDMAKYFGIETEGKSVDQLRSEVSAAKEANKEKWEAYKAEHKAKRLQHLQKIAQEHGIKTKGKTAEQLIMELHKLHGENGEHGKHHKHMHKFKIHQKEESNKEPQAK